MTESYLRKVIKIKLLVLGLAILVSCGGSGGESNPSSTQVQNDATVVSTTPIDSGVLVDVSSPLSIVFDKSIDLATLSGAFAITDDIQGLWSFDSGTNTAIFTPSESLSYFKDYAVTLTATPPSIAGDGLATDYQWSFLTQQQANTDSEVKKEVALLDLTGRNASSNTSTKSLKQAMEIMGIPYSLTTDVNTALSSPFIFTTSYINSGTLTDGEKVLLTAYVNNGGTLISTSLSDNELHSLFGISGALRVNTRSRMFWNVTSKDPTLKYFDDPKEIEISLGSGGGNNIYSRGYVLDTASELARFDDNSVAITKHAYGLGHTYLLGVSYTDVILRNQLNLDYSAQRSNMNDFEPTADTFMLFLRSIYEQNTSNAIWKHTSPAASTSALIVTHDIDSQSSADWVTAFADLESNYNVSASYNVTTHYISDETDGDFYTMNVNHYQTVLSKGHTVSSHSVGHFRDFDNEPVIPKGAAGNTAENYRPYHRNNITYDATVFGELEVSKNLLETDLSTQVKTFRTGHLLYNDFQTEVLEDLGYKYDSSFSANDSLTNFPFRLSYGSAISSDLSSIYEFPLVISGSTFNAQQAGGSASVWLDVLNKNNNNNAITVLLIHPNRDYKLAELETFLQGLPEGLALINMDQFGDYWSARDNFQYTAKTANNILQIIVASSNSFPIHPDISLIINGGLSLSAINIVLDDGTPLTSELSHFGDENLILHRINTE
jgi:hypothetical protein